MSRITGTRLREAVNELVSAFPSPEVLSRFVRASQFAEVDSALVTRSPDDAADSLIIALKARYGDEKAAIVLVEAIEEQLPHRPKNLRKILLDGGPSTRRRPLSTRPWATVAVLTLAGAVVVLAFGIMPPAGLNVLELRPEGEILVAPARPIPEQPTASGHPPAEPLRGTTTSEAEHGEGPNTPEAGAIAAPRAAESEGVRSPYPETSLHVNSSTSVKNGSEVTENPPLTPNGTVATEGLTERRGTSQSEPADQAETAAKPITAPSEAAVALTEASPVVKVVNCGKSVTVSGAGLVEKGDGEIDSDDWTLVEVSYKLTVRSTAIYVSITVRAKEANKDKSFADTVLSIEHETELGSYASKVKLADGTVVSQKEAHWFPGVRHGLQSFPSFGALSEIQVAFDAPGRADASAMKLKAKVSCRAKVSMGQE